MSTKDDERKAMEWLEQAAIGNYGGLTFSQHSADMAAVLRAMLAQPRLPEELTRAQVQLMADAVNGASGRLRSTVTDEQLHLYRAAHRALYAELSKPPEPATKEVDVWRVEFAGPGPACRTYRSEMDARSDVAVLSRQPNVSCITVTGPHRQRVPA